MGISSPLPNFCHVSTIGYERATGMLAVINSWSLMVIPLPKGVTWLTKLTRLTSNNAS